MPLTLITKPTMLPVSVEELKSHSYITTNADDIYIMQLIKAATVWVEGYTKRALLTQTWDWRMDGGFPCTPFNVPKPPLQSVGYIKYYDTDGTLQTLSSSIYSVDSYSEPGRIDLAYGQSWPSVRDVINNVLIRFTCGYGDVTAVEKTVIHALKILVAHLYECREPIIAGAPIANVPYSIEALLWPERVDII